MQRLTDAGRLQHGTIDFSYPVVIPPRLGAPKPQVIFSPQHPSLADAMVLLPSLFHWDSTASERYFNLHHLKAWERALPDTNPAKYDRLGRLFHDRDFDLSQIGGTSFPWGTFLLLRQFGHYLQAKRFPELKKWGRRAFLARYLRDVAYVERTGMEDHIGLALQDVLTQKIIDPFDRYTASAATFFALDVLAACMTKTPES